METREREAAVLICSGVAGMRSSMTCESCQLLTLRGDIHANRNSKGRDCKE